MRADQMVDASGTLVLIGGLGACFGPISAGFAMSTFGPAGFFWWLGLTSAAIGGFALYRRTRRPALPLTEQGAYVAMPRTTARAAAMGAEVASEREDGARQTVREQAQRRA